MASSESSSLSRQPRGLLSLSAIAASAAPIPVPTRENAAGHTSHTGHARTLSTVANGTGTTGAAGAAGALAVHRPRRLSSAGQTRRRVSDARDAASRPSSVAALSALASLSLSTSVSPPPSHATLPMLIHRATSESATPRAVASSVPADAADGGGHIPPSTPKPGKKRGSIYKCESCSKMYRHPSCLIKHRWEHAPQWRAASKFLLSKHQQVQLLEAAAILSHICPPPNPTDGPDTTASDSTRFSSLPEDRSLWPSFVSGGVVPLPNGTTAEPAHAAAADASHAIGDDEDDDIDVDVDVDADDEDDGSSSVNGAVSQSAPTGPRMHRYALPKSQVTQLRPGVFSVPTASSPAVAIVTRSNSGTSSNGMMVDDDEDDDQANAVKTEPKSIPLSGYAAYHKPAGYSYGGQSFSGSAFSPTSLSASAASGGGWSLPSSSLRSSSRSRSRSGSAEAESGQEYSSAGGYPSSSYGYSHSYQHHNTRSSYGDDAEFEEGANLSSYSYSATLRGTRVGKSRSSGFAGVFEVEEEEDNSGAQQQQQQQRLLATVAQQEWDGMDMDMEM